MSQCGSIFLCTVLNGLFVGSSSSQSHTSFCSVFILLLFFVFSTLAPGSVLHLKVQAQPEYQSPRKKPEYQSPRKKVCDEGAGENHDRLKKLPSLPGNISQSRKRPSFFPHNVAKERALGGDVFTYWGSFQHEQQKVSSFLLYCDGAWFLS